MGVGGQGHALADLPPGMTRYPLHRRLGGSQGRSGRVLKISPPPVFDTRTVQLVASRYTDWAIAAHGTLPGTWTKKVADPLRQYFVSGLMLSLMNSAKFCIDLNCKRMHKLCWHIFYISTLNNWCLCGTFGLYVINLTWMEFVLVETTRC
jgi:hypothetical protein